MDRFPASDRYTAVRALGAGSSGRVYEVIDGRDGGRVALKMLDVATRDDFDALRAEFLVLSNLSHPMLAGVRDFGRLGPAGLPYFTQELVDGVDPREWADRDPTKACAVGAQIAWALAYVHEHGLVHLDTKPANIRVDSDRARLLDFGMARRLGDTAFSGGSPAYMAPEVLTGRPFDHRADIYGLGATLYELMCGRPPFVGASVGAVFEQILFANPLPLTTVAPSCPESVSDLVIAMLAREPGARPDHAAGVARALASLAGPDLAPLPAGRPGCIGRDPERRMLADAAGIIRLRGPRGMGKRFLLGLTLRRAQADGHRTGVASGGGLDALAEAVRDAGLNFEAPDTLGLPNADARRLLIDAITGALTPETTLGIVGGDRLPELETEARIIVCTESPGADGLTLEPFSATQVRRFLEATRPGATVTDAVVATAFERTGGNPGHLAIVAVDPDAPLDVGERLNALPDAERDILQTIALAGRAVLASELAEILDSEDEPIVSHLTGLTSRGLAVVEAMAGARRYDVQPPALRARIIGEPLVEAARLPDLASRVALIEPSLAALRAWGDRDTLVQRLRQEAARTVELDRRRTLLAELWALDGARDAGLALESTLDEMGLRVEQGQLLRTLPADEPEVILRAAFHAMWTRENERATTLARRVRKASDDPELTARAHRVDGLVAQRAGDHAAASRSFAAARAALPPEGGDAILRAHTVHDLGVSALYLGRHAEAMPCFREALELKLTHRERAGARITRQNLGICHEALGQPRAALRAWEESLLEAGKLGSPRGEAWNHMALGGLLRRMGRRDVAHEHLQRAQAIAARLGQPLLSSGVETELALLDGSDEVLRQAADRLVAQGDGYGVERLALELAERALRAGRQPEPEWLQGDQLGERQVGARALAMVMGGAAIEVPDGMSPALAIARARQHSTGGRPHEADEILRDALDIAWAPSDRDWLEAELGQAPGASGAAGDASIALDVLAITRELNSGRSSAEVVDLVLDTAISVTEAERGFLLLAAPSRGGGTGKVKIAAARNLDRERVRGGLERLSRGVALEVLRTGEPLLLADAAAAGHLAVDASIRELGLMSVLCVPLRARGGGSLGCLYLDHRFRRRVFAPEMVRFVDLLSDQAALALETARLLESARSHALEIQRLNELLCEREANTRTELDETRLLLAATRSELHTRFAYEGIIGRSQALKKTLSMLDRVIPTELPVLLEGESGTGKELLAKAVHDGGARSRGAFVAVNCGATPHNLFESAFFGHVRGAFTGADQARRGYFELADGGTLFLDEVGELPLDAQAKLLRALETGRFWPVGAQEERGSNARIVCATNRQLDEMVAAGSFREDLFYRLACVRVPVPPLRDRPADVPLLVSHFLDGVPLEPAALAALCAYPWPGNVRELRNEITRAVALLSGSEITLGQLSDSVRSTSRQGAPSGGLPTFRGDLKAYLNDIERRVVAEAMERHQGNLTRTAAFLGSSRFGLRKKLVRLGLRDA